MVATSAGTPLRVTFSVPVARIYTGEVPLEGMGLCKNRRRTPRTLESYMAQ